MSTSTLSQYLMEKRAANRKIVSIYLTAGYPNLDATLPLLSSLVKGGAELIELGVPFSDPLADGPTIQAASQQALEAGITLEKTLDLLREFRKESDVPVILMGYANPFYRYGWEKLCADTVEAGASGFIIPDLPPEESELLDQEALKNGLDLIYLVSPNTPEARVNNVLKNSRGFIYAVSLTGVTGARQSLPEETGIFLKRLKRMTDLPVLIGFGISNTETAKAMAEYGDGVIIGSAVINTIRDSKDLPTACSNVESFVRSIREAI
ncbi:MAG: tryptophan synthase subunit alpha [Calditrichia bacterium]